MDETDRDREREAAVTLAEYAGPTALGLGSLLLQAAERAKLMPAVVEDVSRFADNLERLSESPLGEGTAAGAEALEVAGLLRRGALLLNRPAGSQRARRGDQGDALPAASSGRALRRPDRRRRGESPRRAREADRAALGRQRPLRPAGPARGGDRRHPRHRRGDHPRSARRRARACTRPISATRTPPRPWRSSAGRASRAAQPAPLRRGRPRRRAGLLRGARRPAAHPGQ